MKISKLLIECFLVEILVLSVRANRVVNCLILYLPKAWLRKSMVFRSGIAAGYPPQFSGPRKKVLELSRGPYREPTMSGKEISREDWPLVNLHDYLARAYPIGPTRD